MNLAEREEDRRQTAEHSMVELRERVTGLQTEQESIFDAVGAQIDSACQFLSKDSATKLEVPTNTHTTVHYKKQLLYYSKSCIQICVEYVLLFTKNLLFDL